MRRGCQGAVRVSTCHDEYCLAKRRPAENSVVSAEHRLDSACLVEAGRATTMNEQRGMVNKGTETKKSTNTAELVAIKLGVHVLWVSVDLHLRRHVLRRRRECRHVVLCGSGRLVLLLALRNVTRRHGKRVHAHRAQFVELQRPSFVIALD